MTVIYNELEGSPLSFTSTHALHLRERVETPLMSTKLTGRLVDPVDFLALPSSKHYTKVDDSD